MLVNRTNLRSRGCHTCIKRRVKCDETLPSCMKCIRGKRICPGYRTWDDLFLRPSYTLLTSSESWRQEALPCFLANFTLPGSARRPGHLDFILDLVRTEIHGSTAFRDALMAAAVTYFMRRRKRNDLWPRACYMYGTALESLRLTLSTRDTTDDEATLAAVVLLSRLEIITGNSPTASNPHHQAAAKFISKYSAKASFLSRMGRIAFFVRTEAIIRQLYFSKSTPGLAAPKPPDAIRSWADILPLASSACAALHDAMAQQSDDTSLTIAVEQALSAVDQIRVFAESNRSYQTVPYSGGQDTAAFVLKQAHVFPSIQLGGYWTSLWCSEIRLLELVSEASIASPCSSDTANDSSSAASLAYNVMATTPFLLGEIDSNGRPLSPVQCPVGPGPMMLSAGLFVTGSCSAVASDQRAWIMDRLAFIGNERGIGQALVFREDILKKWYSPVTNC